MTARTSPLRGAIARHPIAAYIVIAFAASWAFTFLLSISVFFGLVALFGPAVGAFVVSWADGSGQELRHRITGWRQSPRSYLAAFGIPFVATAGALAVYLLLGKPGPGVGSIGAIEILIFVLVIGEEIGWRGFLMPRLRARLSLPIAGLATGVVWTAWHLPIYLAPDQGLFAFAVFAWWVVPFAVVMGYVAERARYSVVVATVMHGAANIAMPILLPNIDRTTTLLSTGAVYLVIAVVLVLRSSMRRAPAGAPVFEKQEVAA